MSENNQMMSVEGQLVGMPLAGPESFSQQQLEYLKRAMGVDETVLYDNGTTTSASLSESGYHFDRIRVYYTRAGGFCQEFPMFDNPTYIQISHTNAYTNSWRSTFAYRYDFDGVSLTPSAYCIETASKTDTTTITTRTSNPPTILKVVGVNRIAGGNQ